MPIARYDSDKRLSLKPQQVCQFYELMSSTVIRVRNESINNNKEFKEGGGVFVGEGYVLTTANLVRQLRGGSKFSVFTKNNRRYNATLISIPSPPDTIVQLLKLDEKLDTNIYAETAENLMEGCDVLIINHSYGSYYGFTKGIVSFAQRRVEELNLEEYKLAINLDPKKDKKRKIVQMSQLYCGYDGVASLSEGCPVFNSLGEVVAIYGFSRDKFDYGFPISRELMDRMLCQMEVKRPDVGCSKS